MSADAFEAWAQKFDLTRAERELLALVSEGLDHAAIAARRGTAKSTVKKQASRLCRKTGARSLAKAALRMVSESAHE